MKQPFHFEEGLYLYLPDIGHEQTNGPRRRRHRTRAIRQRLSLAADFAAQPAFSTPIRSKRCVTITSPDPETIATNETRTTPGSPPPRFFEIHVVSSIIPGSIAPLQTMSTVSISGQKVFIPVCYFMKRPVEYCL
ncbi:hypothetical protein QA600_14910 [Natronococcus sp. A-GB1]|uniref:hypothetical protein n=1 Tax=Natronococcus sp. A-GB1 TaxID=3037648 RepID=UPI00241D95D4|nr:hypothetical protein [Natronococcus sp. A-GB1]MDG5760625.1 hypothetical protein [Natronococcus sp. A-GB1]